MPLYQTVFTNLKSVKLEKQGFGEGNIVYNSVQQSKK
jgi:hypothetical protein